MDEMVSQVSEYIDGKVCVRERKRVCGLLLVDEKVVFKNVHLSLKNHNYDNCLLIGSIVVNQCTTDACGLRDVICEQLPSVPQCFAFLTNDGWPIAKNQESSVISPDIINERNTIYICKTFDKTKIGVCTAKGENIGFVFGDYFTPLQQLRPQIQEILDENSNKRTKFTFKFVEKNGWPITNNQESLLTVCDILINQQINIKYTIEVEEAITKVNIEYPMCDKEPVTKIDSLITIKDASEDNTDAGKTLETVNRWKKVASKKSMKRVGTRKVGLRFKSMKLTKAHPVMISYARQEAAQHALNLKMELVKLGFSVYLDVHEIRTGTDWQDNLNSAVSNCLVFIPLVTPIYGKTQWTNREIKLADILHKKIIPINFLENWPPECLAIQFATTQYIPWRPPECDADIKWDHIGQTDISNWPGNCLKRVAKLIAEQIPSKVPREKLSRTVSDKSTSIEGKPLIVISGHPKQRNVSLEVKVALEEEGYNVWCSNEFSETIDDSDGLTVTEQKPKLELQKPLSTICEEEQEFVFNENIKKIPRNFSETQTNSLEIPKISHPPLTKTMSTLSNISQISMTSQKLAFLKEFQEKVSNAALIIVLASQAYYTSRTSRQHVYYCEHRKKVIVIQCDHSPPSSWFSMLLRNEMPLSYNDTKFIDNLKRQIRRILNPLTKTLNKNLNESKIQVLVTFLSKNLPVLGSCVYVIGSAHTENTRTLEICKQIGVEMAKVKNITLVTGGCTGAADLIAENFFEIISKDRRPSLSKQLTKGAIMNNNNGSDTSLVHVLPSKDTEDLSSKYKQNEEGNFESMPFGETLFVGESIEERNLVISRLMDTCILIEGDAEDSKVAQEFLWNDHYVIPIVSTNGAASGSFGLPSKTFECPIGVNNGDWNILSTQSATPVEVARAVVRIVVQIKKSIVYHALCKLGNKGKPMLRQNLRQSKRRRKATLKKRKVGNGIENNSDRSMHSEKVLPIINLEEKKPRHFKPWANVVQLFSFSKK